MNRKDRVAWLDADPALRAAWDGFRGSLDRVSARIAAGQPTDLDQL